MSNRNINPSRKTGTFEGRLLTYALAGGAMLAAGGPAQAAIIHYSGPTLDTAGSSVNLDLDGDLITDFTFLAGTGDDASNPITAYVSFPLGGVSVPLAFGTTVDSSVTTGTSSYKVAKASVDSSGAITDSSGAYALNSDQYMGLQFEISGATHFGWALIRPVGSGYADLGVGHGTLDIQIKEFAYETADRAAITAGATSAVPEPSSLAMFALGAAGIAALRRRRKAA